MDVSEVKVKGEVIRLGQFVKLAELVSSGGEAKIRVQAGEVLVNGQVEPRRGLQLKDGDRVELAGEVCIVKYI